MSQKGCADFCEKNFSGLHRPVSVLAGTLPLHPLGSCKGLTLNRFAMYNDRQTAKTATKKAKFFVKIFQVIDNQRIAQNTLICAIYNSLNTNTLQNQLKKFFFN